MLILKYILKLKSSICWTKKGQGRDSREGVELEGQAVVLLGSILTVDNGWPYQNDLMVPDSVGLDSDHGNWKKNIKLLERCNIS